MSERSSPPYPVWVEVDLGRFRGNLRAIRTHLPPSCELILVLKSDAYGHGTVPLAKAARKEGLLGRIGIATFFDNSIYVASIHIANVNLVCAAIPVRRKCYLPAGRRENGSRIHRGIIGDVATVGTVQI